MPDPRPDVNELIYVGEFDGEVLERVATFTPTQRIDSKNTMTRSRAVIMDDHDASMLRWETISEFR